MHSCVVINLARRTDRREQFAEYAAAANLRYEFVPGEQFTTAQVPSWWKDSAGSFGSSRTHMRELRRGTGDLLVFEDDARVPPDFNERLFQLRQAADRLSKPWAIIKLGGEHQEPPVNLADGSGLLKRCSLCTRGHAYLIRRAYRQHLADAIDRATYHWDATLAALDRSWFNVCPDPFLVMTYWASSDIPDSRPLILPSRNGSKGGS